MLSHSFCLLQVVFFLKQMAPEEADEKYENVMRQRHMFIYKKECAAAPFPSTLQTSYILRTASNLRGRPSSLLGAHTALHVLHSLLV